MYVDLPCGKYVNININATTPTESVRVGTSFESSGFLDSESALGQHGDEMIMTYHSARCEAK